MDLTNEDVADILALLDSLPYDELDLQTPRFRLTLRRTPDGWTQAVESRSVPNVLAGPGAGSAPDPAGVEGDFGVRGPQAPSSGAGGTQAPIGSHHSEADEADGELVAVRAPLPGTFYRAPRPGVAPFVEVGSQVGPDTVVGIVETMKLMNSVTAGVDGTVAEICLGNAEFAAHGATLLRISVG
jgi:acetyl-CoA carboxylase biotin carboxyl carrier protein